MPGVSFQSRALGVALGNPDGRSEASRAIVGRFTLELDPRATRLSVVSTFDVASIARGVALGDTPDVICAAIAGRGVPPAPKAMFGPPFSPSEARGVALGDASRTAIGRCEFPPPSVFVVRPPSRSEAFGVGHARGVSEFPNRTASVSETPG